MFDDEDGATYVSTLATVPGDHDARPLDSGAAVGCTRPPQEAQNQKPCGDKAAGNAMTGDEVRQVFEAMLPQEEPDRAC